MQYGKQFIKTFPKGKKEAEKWLWFNYDYFCASIDNYNNQKFDDLKKLELPIIGFWHEKIRDALVWIDFYNQVDMSFDDIQDMKDRDSV